MIKFVPHSEVCKSNEKFDPTKHRIITVFDRSRKPIKWVGATYRRDYERIFADIGSGKISSEPNNDGVIPAISLYRDLILNDLFFLSFFIMENPLMNTPFGVAACRIVENGFDDMSLDVWARGHLKTFLLSQAETIQTILKNPELCQVIFSYKKPKAEDIVASIKRTLEMPILKQCFSDILYENPDRESPSWSVQGGLIVKRQSASRKEKTVESYGVLEGMPTGGHWDILKYDDIETADLAKNPDQLQVLIEMYNYSRNLGSPNSKKRIIGTYYSHCGLLVYLKDKLSIHNDFMYNTRIIPATDDGTIDGKPIFLSQEELDSLKSDSTFNQMQLCNPTPLKEIKLDFSLLHPIEPRFLPKNRIKFVIVDPAGDDTVQKKGAVNDNWAILCLSVKPNVDDLGLSEVYLEDMVCEKMGISEAIDAACQVYIRNGRIKEIGIEKIGSDTTYEHIRKALKENAKTKGRYIEIIKGDDIGGIRLLSSKGRSKNSRIEAALSWPLNNGKLFYSTALSGEKIETIRNEMNKFPFFHVDILDAWAYLYDILTHYNWRTIGATEDDEEEDDRKMGKKPIRQAANSWMYV